jgi:hypothetical protein
VRDLEGKENELMFLIVRTYALSLILSQRERGTRRNSFFL